MSRDILAKLVYLLSVKEWCESPSGRIAGISDRGRAVDAETGREVFSRSAALQRANHFGGIMRKIRLGLSWASAGLLPVLALAAGAWGQTTYTDAQYDQWGDNSADISTVAISNDGVNIYFTITMNPYANIGTSGTNSDYYASYEVGIQTNGGAGGQTAINGSYGTGDPTVGNPWGNAIGISSGMTYFMGSYLAGPSYSGGAQLFSYSSAAGVGWTQIGATAPITEVTSDGSGSPPPASVSFAFPLASMGLSLGSSFNFDVWTTYGNPGGQGAYDALDNNGTGSATAPYSGGTYDAATATGSTFATTVYTVVPEPTSLALLGGAGLLMMRRRRAS
jgi:hypothetical protein